MNRVQEVNRINQRELEMGGDGSKGSWHDEYKDSAYIYVGGLPDGITEGDLITICSQYGEIVDVNMPRDKDTGKTRGFGFIMYEDQRSTVLAVDNLNGGQVVDRTIRVDHVKNYKQPKVMNDEGEMMERDEQSLNALPKLVRDGYVSDDGSVSSVASIDPEDPMRDYLLQKRLEEKSSKKRKRDTETPEERKERKERKRAKKDAKRLLPREGVSSHSGSKARRRHADEDMDRDRDRDVNRGKHDDKRRRPSRSPSRTPPRTFRAGQLVSPTRRPRTRSRSPGPTSRSEKPPRSRTSPGAIPRFDNAASSERSPRSKPSRYERDDSGRDRPRFDDRDSGWGNRQHRVESDRDGGGGGERRYRDRSGRSPTR